MNFEIAGTLHKIYEIESKTSSFQTREFVLLSEGTYPQYIKFQATQDKCAILDPYNEGEKVKVSFDLRGREWQGKYFTNLNAWKIDRLSAVATPANDDFPSIDQEPPSGFDSFDGGGAAFDDLPF